MRLFHYAIATWWGSGLCPKAPGTAGSLATLPFVVLVLLFAPIEWLNQSFLGINLFFPLSIIIAILSYPGVKYVIVQEKDDDPAKVVIDEVVGQCMAFAFVSLNLLKNHPWLLLVGFAFFRFFDILKPLGIKRLEKIPGAVGVISDDLLGGIYAGLLLKTLLLFIF
ncbi:MAG: phosphatidylglycerophosphatase A [Fibrobacter sp.]|nr:phosphatidylglycerophosphatase A [Fibrobacter sp.]